MAVHQEEIRPLAETPAFTSTNHLQQTVPIAGGLLGVLNKRATESNFATQWADLSTYPFKLIGS